MSKEFHTTQQHILDTGRAIILGKGFAAVGLNEILTSAGVPKGSFYHYFKSKEEFGNALLQDYFDQSLAHLNAMLAAENVLASVKLIRYFQDWSNTQSCEGVQGKCVVVKLSAEVADLSETMRATLEQGTEQMVATLATCIERGIGEQSLHPSLNAETSAQVLYQMWLGATVLSKVHRSRQALDAALLATYRLLGISPASIT